MQTKKIAFAYLDLYTQTDCSLNQMENIIKKKKVIFEETKIVTESALQSQAQGQPLAIIRLSQFLLA